MTPELGTSVGVNMKVLSPFLRTHRHLGDEQTAYDRSDLEYSINGEEDHGISTSSWGLAEAQDAVYPLYMWLHSFQEQDISDQGQLEASVLQPGNSFPLQTCSPSPGVIMA